MLSLGTLKSSSRSLIKSASNAAAQCSNLGIVNCFKGATLVREVSIDTCTFPSLTTLRILAVMITGANHPNGSNKRATSDRIDRFVIIPMISGHILRRTSAAGIDQLETDGEPFVKRLVHGEKMSTMPGYLLFTAPYKVCKGSCEDSEGKFAMAFPLYVGKKGQDKFKELYERDYPKFYSMQKNAPFKTRHTRKMFTLCISKITEEQTTAPPTPLVTETESIDIETPAMSTQVMFLNLIEDSDSENTILETLITTSSIDSETAPITLTTETTIGSDIPTYFETPTDSETPTIIFTTEIPTGSETPTIISTTEIPSDSEAHITFEDYKDTTDVVPEDPEETFVTNSKGLRCPTRSCNNKKTKQVTSKIVFLKHTKVDSHIKKPDLRNAALDLDDPNWIMDSFYY